MKQRLDLLLVARGLADSRTRAQALVMEGKVRVGEDGAEVEVEAPPRFVSRGGEKLEGAFALWGEGVRPSVLEGLASLESLEKLDVLDKVCLDVGSSTGGFTDCLLQHGAKQVMAVDVGTNQLAYKLRADPRVWVRENYNARFMKAADLPQVPDVAVTDVSFISLKLILPPIAEVLAPGGRIVALIKPQFEVGKGKAPGGLVRDEALRLAARDEIVRFVLKRLGDRACALGLYFGKLRHTVDPSHFHQFREGLVNRPYVSGVSDRKNYPVRYIVIELIHYLEKNRFLSFRPVRIDRIQKIQLLFFGHLSRQCERVVEVAVDRQDFRSEEHCLRQLSGRDLSRGEEHGAFQTRLRSVCGERCGCVPCGCASDGFHAKFDCMRYAHGHSAVFERSGRVRPLVLDV